MLSLYFMLSHRQCSFSLPVIIVLLFLPPALVFVPCGTHLSHRPALLTAPAWLLGAQRLIAPVVDIHTHTSYAGLEGM